MKENNYLMETMSAAVAAGFSEVSFLATNLRNFASSHGFDTMLSCLEIAAACHFSQHRKLSGAPYLVHPMSVCQALINAGIYTESILCAAILHDVLEDCCAVEDLFTLGVPFEVVNLCILLDKSGMTEENYLLKLSRSTEAICIKLADRFDNTTDLIYRSESKRQEYIYETQRILDLVQYVDSSMETSAAAISAEIAENIAAVA